MTRPELCRYNLAIGGVSDVIRRVNRLGVLRPPALPGGLHLGSRKRKLGRCNKTTAVSTSPRLFCAQQFAPGQASARDPWLVTCGAPFAQQCFASDAESRALTQHLDDLHFNPGRVLEKLATCNSQKGLVDCSRRFRPSTCTAQPLSTVLHYFQVRRGTTMAWV